MPNIIMIELSGNKTFDDVKILGNEIVVSISDSTITSLEGIPDTIKEIYLVNCWNLTSLEHCPSNLDTISISECPITSLKYLPNKMSGIVAFYTKISSLEHCPSKIDKLLSIQDSSITNLKGVHEIFKNGYCKSLIMNNNKITSHVLGVLKIPNLEFLQIEEYDDLNVIVNKHLHSGRDVIECQEELIKAGYADFAKL